MKELSIEEKAKRYDEALKVLHKYDGANIMFSQSLKEEMFPELCELEDEKTKKEIINYLECQSRDEPSRKDTHNKWIRYIEKYALSKDDYSFLRDCARVLKTFGWQSYADRLTALCPALGEEAKAMMSTPIIFDESEDERIVKELLTFFRESIHGGHILTNKEYDSWIAWLEKQGEQKPAEDVDLPEFESYLCLMFQKFRTKGICTNGEIIDYVKEHSQKLKDILVKPAWSEEDRQTLHLIIDDLSEELNDEPDEADKEILCRKISFLNSLKPQPIHKWDREDNKVKLEITNYFECQQREEPTRTDILNKWIAWIANLGPQWKQNPAWSEEDELKIDFISKLILGLDQEKYDSQCMKELADWLKSLKERVQSKQEWSQNDIDMIDWLIRCCEKEYEELCNDKYGHQDIVSDLKRDCRKKWNWLESLKNRVIPKNQWKPSEE